VVFLLLAASFGTAAAQAPGKVPRVGFLSPTTPSPNSPLNAFLQGLRELGWVEGKNIAIEYRWAEDRPERLADLAAELVRLKVDVILTSATPAAVAAKNATGTIPIVMASAVDVVGFGLATSLARPGGNVTGLSFDVGWNTVSKGLELLKETVPKVRRVAVLSNPTNPSHALAISEVRLAARSLGVQLQLLEARGPNEFDSAFAAIARERAEALLVPAEAMFNANRTRLLEVASKHRLPAMYGGREYVVAGGLISYGPDLRDHFRRAATYVDKILKGAKPAELPIEQPTKFEVVINLKTAKALGLTIPRSVLLRADQLVE